MLAEEEVRVNVLPEVMVNEKVRGSYSQEYGHNLPSPLKGRGVENEASLS
jgi:hypothetical protein